MIDYWLGKLLAGDVDEIGRFVVTGGDVVGGEKLFNEAGFQKQGLEF